MTKRECAIIMAFTGSCMLTGENLKSFYKYIEELMGRPVMTHEIATLAEEIKERSRGDFIDLCRSAYDDKSDSKDMAKTNTNPEETLPGLVKKMVFDEEYFKSGRMFCLDTYEVRMPRTKDDGWTQVRKKKRTPIMVSAVINYGATLKFYDMFERIEREISVSQYYHGYYRFVEAAIVTEDQKELLCDE